MKPSGDIGSEPQLRTDQPISKVVIGPKRMGQHDLNARPKSTSGESRTWVNPARDNHSPVESSPSINQANSQSSAANEDSMKSVQEIEAMMELGEKLGFKLDGKKEQVSRMNKKRGANSRSQ
ncbi:hypothetical protein L2E82_17408 [Cichorium intybus]|uniref:Uncharacterized protein n=1 Tax=Cichorium intybus TaxID=13427 RepID=A0ACB9F937_CICIN|nr:hypothetical protein L2E82_17408 [Cichorium intybus]